MRNVVVCALAALLLAGCGPRQRQGGNGGSGGGGGGGGTDKPPASLAVTPATSTVALQPFGGAPGKFSGSAKLTATATYADGSSADVSAVATWSAADATASVANGDVTLFGVGQYKVTATLAMVSGDATLTATLSASVDNTGFDPNDHGKLDGNPDAAQVPTVAYPLDGAIFPVNLAPIEVHVQKSDPSQTLARISLRSGPLLQLDVYAVCKPSPNGGQFPNACIVPITGALATQLAGASEMADVSVRARLAAPDGSKLGESAARAVGWSKTGLSGGLYYWTTAGAGDTTFNTAIARYDFNGDASTPSIYLSSDKAPAVPTGQTQCIGCHAVSPDGARLAFSLGGSLPAYFSLFDVAKRAPIATNMTDKFVDMMTFSPDGNRMVTMTYGKLALRAADAGLAVLTADLFAADVKESLSHPFWSRDGKRFAFVSWVPGQYGAAADAQSVTGDLVQGGQIWIADSDGQKMFGTPRLLVPRGVAAAGTTGYSYYYPAISDDNAFVVFNRSACDGPTDNTADAWGPGACDGYNDFSAQLAVVPSAGGTPVVLARASGTQTWTNSWPRWSPDHGTYRGKTLYWIAFSSRRDYGLVLKGSTDGAARPQLWFTTIVVDPAAPLAADPSSAPVWLPGQDPDLTGPRGSHTPVWTAAAVPIGRPISR